MWIHECKEWPNFRWQSSKIEPLLAETRYNQGLVLGKMKSLRFDLKQEASLNILTEDVIKTSAIEGESLDSTEVRSSIAKRLGIKIAGLDKSSRNVEGIVEVMLDATQGYSKKMTKARIFNWHAALFPTGRSGMNKIAVGKWRRASMGPMQVVSGPIDKEKIHFEAPEASRVNKEITAFLKWFNNDSETTDLVLKAGIAHFWFVTIHPFEDGNGRIARALGDMVLAKADGSSERFYSLSTQIENDRSSYYKALESQQKKKIDITDWLLWYLECLSIAISNSSETLSKVLLKSKVWELANSYQLNNRQENTINRMLEESFKGFMNTSKYARMNKCSNDTALRDIQQFKKYGIFVQNCGKGRSTSYRITEALE